MTPAGQIATAFALREQGRLAEAATLAVSLLETTEWHRALELAAVCSAEGRGFNEFAALLQVAASKGYGMPLLFSRVLDNCLRTDQFALIEEIAQRTPRENPLHVLAIYYVGCVRVVRRDAAAALAIFEYFRQIVPGTLPHIPFDADANLNVLYRQGILVAAPAEIERRLAQVPTLPPAFADFAMIETARPPRILVAAVADARYAERFARTLMPSVAPEDGLHLHVVDPVPETTALLDELAAGAGPGRFGASTSRDPNYGTATAYACARFFALPHLLGIYERPIVAVDIDVRLTERFGELAATAPSYDFACFDSGRREPSSVYQAGVMIAVPTPSTLDFLTALGGFCQYGLQLPLSASWLLDQAALYSLKHYFSVMRPAFRFQVLNDTTGGKALDFIALVTTDEEKFEMRSALGMKPRGTG